MRMFNDVETKGMSGLILGLTEGISHVHPLITRLQYSLLDRSNVELAL